MKQFPFEETFPFSYLRQKKFISHSHSFVSLTKCLPQKNHLLEAFIKGHVSSHLFCFKNINKDNGRSMLFVLSEIVSLISAEIMKIHSELEQDISYLRKFDTCLEHDF